MFQFRVVRGSPEFVNARMNVLVGEGWQLIGPAVSCSGDVLVTMQKEVVKH